MSTTHQIGRTQPRLRALAFAGAIVAAALGTLATSPGSAADFGPRVVAPLLPPPYNWTGFSFGFNAGGGWGESEYLAADGLHGTLPFFTKGGMVGATVGADYQFYQTVFGVLGDADWSFVEGGAQCDGTNFTCAVRNDWLNTLRGRAGYAFDNILFYVSGGGAWGNIKADRPTLGGQHMDRVGWTAGGGVEVSLIPNVSFKLEYLHIDLGRGICAMPNCSQTADVSIPMQLDTVRLGVNYRLNAWPHF